MEQRVKKLYKASIEGSLTSLHDLLQEDPLLLDRFTVTSYAETPLHIAAMLGHFGFCSELLSQKSGLSEELDSRRSSALHLASAKGHVEIVKILLVSRPKMCLVVDGDGNNPIHLAAMKGRVDVLNELVRVHPDAGLSRVRICEGGTIFHLCVQYCQFEALKFLIQVLKNEELLNAKDDDGNTILHLAVTNKQVEIIQYLIANSQIDASALNLNGLTALELLIQIQRDSKYLQVLAHSLQQSSMQSAQRSQQTSSSHHNLICFASSTTTSNNNDQDLLGKNKFDQKSWLENQRNSIMVVASLIATMAFQAGTSPRGGFWQDDSHTHEAGNPIWKDKNPNNYKVFLHSNTIGFLSSLTIILFLISGLPFKYKFFMWILTVIMWISISATTLTYLISVAYEFGWSRYIWIDLMAFLIMVHTIRFVFQRTRCWTVKHKVFFWIFMSIIFISVFEELWRRILGHFASYDIGLLFFYIFICLWMVLVTFLILQYVFQLVRFIVRKMRSCFQKLELYLNLSNQNPIGV